MIYVITFMLTVSGMFIIASEVLGLPPSSTGKSVRIAVKQEKSFMDILNHFFILPMVKMIAPLLCLADFKEKRMAVQLARAEIELTPKEYYARSFLMATAVCIITFAMLSLTMKDIAVVSVILAVVVFFHFHGEIKDKLKQKDKLIEKELPKFIRAIVQGLKTEKDIIKLLETYETIAGIGLKYDIEVLIMDLKSGNFEEGMAEFDKRVGNSYVSRLSKALISANRGDNQDSTLNYLLSDMGLLAKEMMQRELAKRPGRVKILVIPIVVIAVIALFYVIGNNLFSSLSGIM